jgi:hypothetical protein
MSSLSGCRVEIAGLGAIVVRGRVWVVLNRKDFKREEWVVLYIGKKRAWKKVTLFLPLSDVGAIR